MLTVGRFQRIGMVICACVPCLFLQGCGPAQVGFTGISKSSNGELLGVVQVCRSGVDKAVLRAADAGVKVQWRRSSPVRGVSVWPLEAGGDWWERSGDPGILRQNHTFRLTAYRGDSSITVRVESDQNKLALLTAGQVLFRYSAPGASGYGKDRIASLAKFRRLACSK
ncbi:hypothetical protein AB0L06_32525 [Spirillospora sp. NPDC052269]